LTSQAASILGLRFHCFCLIHIADILARLELALPLFLCLFGFLFDKLITNVSALNLARSGPVTRNDPISYAPQRCSLRKGMTLLIACCSLWDRLGHDDTLGNLEFGNLPVKSRLEFLFNLAVALSTGVLHDDRGPDLLAILFVGDSKGHRLGYKRQSQDGRIELDGRDLFASTVDELVSRIGQSGPGKHAYSNGSPLLAFR
jgi:hypothetical protein